MMNHSPKRFLWTAVLAATLLVGACSDDANLAGSAAEDIGGSNDMENIDLNLDYGGLAYSDETPAFGDEALRAEAEREEARAREQDEGDALLEGSPELHHPDVVRIYVRALWGVLDGRPGETGDAVDYARIDWSGGMSVDNGAILLRKTILFEPPTDYPLPRDDRQSLDWVSVTGPHKDGVLVCVAVRPNEDGLLEGQLTFDTGPLDIQLALADLDEFDEVYPTDMEGISVSIAAFTVRPDDCPSGFLGGYWRSQVDDEHGGGWFRGRVTNAAGRLRGFMAGRFGLNADGEPVFRGKFIDGEGNVLGLLRGQYAPAGDGSGMGEFRGHWANRNGEHMGVLGGRYESLPKGGEGFFQGRWRERCATVDGDS